MRGSVSIPIVRGGRLRRHGDRIRLEVRDRVSIPIVRGLRLRPPARGRRGLGRPPPSQSPSFGVFVFGLRAVACGSARDFMSQSPSFGVFVFGHEGIPPPAGLGRGSQSPSFGVFVFGWSRRSGCWPRRSGLNPHRSGSSSSAEWDTGAWPVAEMLSQSPSFGVFVFGERRYDMMRAHLGLSQSPSFGVFVFGRLWALTHAVASTRLNPHRSGSSSSAPPLGRDANRRLLVSIPIVRGLRLRPNERRKRRGGRRGGLNPHRSGSSSSALTSTSSTSALTKGLNPHRSGSSSSAASPSAKTPRGVSSSQSPSFGVFVFGSRLE